MISEKRLDELAQDCSHKRLSRFSIRDELPVSSIEDIAEEAYKSGYRQAEAEAVELLDNSHRALILIEDTYSILLNNGSPKITQEMEQISEAIDLLKQTLAKRMRCCV